MVVIIIVYLLLKGGWVWLINLEEILSFDKIFLVSFWKENYFFRVVSISGLI